MHVPHRGEVTAELADVSHGRVVEVPRHLGLFLIPEDDAANRARPDGILSTPLCLEVRSPLLELARFLELAKEKRNVSHSRLHSVFSLWDTPRVGGAHGMDREASCDVLGITPRIRG